MKVRSTSVLLYSVLMVTTPVVLAEPLVLATWNIEHLNEDDNVGCLPRTGDDYLYIADRIRALNADVIAIQEVESVKAAYRVFPIDEWVVLMSRRPNTRGDDGGPICWETEDRHLRHQATGIAVRPNANFETHEGFAALAVDNPDQRWGSDVTIRRDDLSFRLLSVHLASGCWGPEEDVDDSRAPICTTLQGQIAQLVKWIQERNAQQEAFVVLGDFNRRLTMAGDWAASQLLAEELNTSLLTANLRDGTTTEDWCDAQYPDLIDHIIVSNSLVGRIVADSTQEHERGREHPDHCIISTTIN